MNLLATKIPRYSLSKRCLDRANLYPFSILSGLVPPQPKGMYKPKQAGPRTRSQIANRGRRQRLVPLMQVAELLCTNKKVGQRLTISASVTKLFMPWL